MPTMLVGKQLILSLATLDTKLICDSWEISIVSFAPFTIGDIDLLWTLCIYRGPMAELGYYSSSSSNWLVKNSTSWSVYQKLHADSMPIDQSPSLTQHVQSVSTGITVFDRLTLDCHPRLLRVMNLGANGCDNELDRFVVVMHQIRDRWGVVWVHRPNSYLRSAKHTTSQATEAHSQLSRLLDLTCITPVLFQAYLSKPITNHDAIWGWYITSDFINYTPL